MSLITENLFDRLDSIIKEFRSGDLGIRGRGGGGYRCSTLMWKTEEKGDFSFANLIMDLGYIKSIEIDEFIEHKDLSTERTTSQMMSPLNGNEILLDAILIAENF